MPRCDTSARGRLVEGVWLLPGQYPNSWWNQENLSLASHRSITFRPSAERRLPAQQDPSQVTIAG